MRLHEILKYMSLQVVKFAHRLKSNLDTLDTEQEQESCIQDSSQVLFSGSLNFSAFSHETFE